MMSVFGQNPLDGLRHLRRSLREKGRCLGEWSEIRCWDTDFSFSFCKIVFLVVWYMGLRVWALDARNGDG